MEPILDAPVSAQRNIQYAGFWIRVAATIIDSLVLQFGLGLVLGIIVVAINTTGSEEMYILVFIVFIVVYIGYYPLMESSSRQATLGKMAVGIKVGNQYGERLSFGNALGRFFAKILSGLTLYIGYMMAGWDDKKQALHDKIADTYVFYAPGS